MAATTVPFRERFQESISQRFNWQYFLQDNVTGSWFLTVWVVILLLATLGLTIRQMGVFPGATIIILLAWFIGILLTAGEGLHIYHSRVGRWLKTNMFNSISNTLLSLFLLLVLYALLYGIWQWAVVNATFSQYLTEPQDRPQDGATWGVIVGAWDLLMYGRFPREQLYRVWAVVAFFVVMAIVSFAANKSGLWERINPLRKVLLALWVVSPVIVYILLAGVPADGDFINPRTLIIGEILVLGTFALVAWQRVIKFSWLSLIIWAFAWPAAYIVWRAIGRTGAFRPINVSLWGGLLLTLIIASAVIILSFPMGMVLALGRRSQIRGIPWWLIWPVAIIVTIWGFTTSTPEILASADNTAQQVIAFWPLLILLLAYILNTTFKGNVIAAASTAFIEFIRGVPLITLLFMAIIMAPFFLGEGATLENVWAVILGYALFSAAYMAELIRGGLQAIPRGQYDAGDAIGLNTFQKMRFIILPQAITIVIPGIVGQFIGSYKSSSLVAIVGLFELLGITRVIVSNPQWLGLRLELYVFVGVVYFVGSFIMSWYSRRMEARLSIGQN
ncbi:MAG: amino acid ABC transporter permease [Anaerolineales bacterium]|nr:amino acid ABC transporter permease [Anaerolineales bacterium]